MSSVFQRFHKKKNEFDFDFERARDHFNDRCGQLTCCSYWEKLTRQPACPPQKVCTPNCASCNSPIFKFNIIWLIRYAAGPETIIQCHLISFSNYKHTEKREYYSSGCAQHSINSFVIRKQSHSKMIHYKRFIFRLQQRKWVANMCPWYHKLN